jgi:hypothetical protein
VNNGVPDVKGSINQTGDRLLNVEGVYYWSTQF